MAAPAPAGARVVRGKMVVVGAAEAGKSALIAALCPSSMNLEVRGRTVAMDHGMLTRGGSCLSLVGVPGQERFAGVRQALAKGALVAVWVHTAGAEADRLTAELIRTAAIPYLVYVNLHGRSAGRWPAPTSLPRPRTVIVGDLLDPMRSELAALEAEIWRLVAALPGGVAGPT